MNEEIQALREEIAKLRERVAVLEAKFKLDVPPPMPQFLPLQPHTSQTPWKPPFTITSVGNI